MKCPRCGRTCVPQGGYLWCTHCKALFDEDENEGGDYFTDPTRRLELAEEREARREDRNGGRDRIQR